MEAWVFLPDSPNARSYPFFTWRDILVFLDTRPFAAFFRNGNASFIPDWAGMS